MTVFDRAWALVKNEDGQIQCPICEEIGDGNWYFAHFPECAQRYVNENSQNVEVIRNDEKDEFREALHQAEILGIPINDLQPMVDAVDAMDDFTTKFSGYRGITPEQSDALWDAKEKAWLDAASKDGRIGYHPDPDVRRENTTWRVGLHFDNDQGLHDMLNEWISQRFDSSDLDAAGFGEYMAELLEDTTVGEELRDNERTWDDVDWDKIIMDRHESHVDDWYRGLASGEHDEEDWIYRDHYVDDDEHEKNVENARFWQVNPRIRHLVQQSLTERGIDGMHNYNSETGEMEGPSYDDIFNTTWKQMVRDLQDPTRRSEAGIDDTDFDAYMRSYLRRYPDAL
jgi:uncharacterized Zn finger protein (UPF0148 family)